MYPRVLKPPLSSAPTCDLAQRRLAKDFRFSTGHSKKHIRWNEEFFPQHLAEWYTSYLNLENKYRTNSFSPLHWNPRHVFGRLLCSRGRGARGGTQWAMGTAAAGGSCVSTQVRRCFSPLHPRRLEGGSSKRARILLVFLLLPLSIGARNNRRAGSPRVPPFLVLDTASGTKSGAEEWAWVTEANVFCASRCSKLSSDRAALSLRDIQSSPAGPNPDE